MLPCSSPMSGAASTCTAASAWSSGQRLMQALTDIFLGWTHTSTVDFYVRQLRDMKGSVDLLRMRDSTLVGYAALCGRTLARAHARSVGPGLISGYLGRGRTFADAIAEFSVAYADLTERDLRVARRSGAQRSHLDAAPSSTSRWLDDSRRRRPGGRRHPRTSREHLPSAAERKRWPRLRSTFWRRNALGLSCFVIFGVLVVALILTGQRAFNADQVDHGQATVSLGGYLHQGHFWEAHLRELGERVPPDGAPTSCSRSSSSSRARPSRRTPTSTRPSTTTRATPTSASRCRGRSGAAASRSCSTRTRCCIAFVVLFVALVRRPRPRRRRRVQRGAAGARRGDGRRVWSYVTQLASSGSSRSRTGRASSSPCSRSSCCRSSCASAARRSRSRSPRRTPRPDRADRPVRSTRCRAKA